MSFKKDPAVLAIANTWSGDYDSAVFESMGFENDDPATGYSMAVADFRESLKTEGKLV